MFEDLMFGYTTSPQVAAKYEVTPPAIRMHFPHDEKVALLQGNPADAQAVETFVRAHRHPLVVNFSGEVAPELFADGRPILFLFRDKDEKGQAVEKALAEAAPSSKRRVLFSVCGSNEPMDQRLMDYVGVEPEDLPTARLVSNPSAALVKYKLEGEITASSLSAFVEGFEAGTLKPHLRSQPPPASQPGPVKVLVGSTFRETAMDPTKDVLIEFYAPWCGHCKKLEPVYRDLAKKLESVQTLVIAKMDVTENDAAGLDIQGFPTIKFWRGDKKDDPLDYDGDRDVDSFVQWLEEKVTHPFNREELKNEL
jgi:protein disulfide isomerase